MQHNRAGRKLGRTTAHRRSLFRNQLSSLFTHERITTTLYKAKELRPLAEKMVTLGKRGGLHARRLAVKSLPDKTALKKCFDEIAPRFATRPGGYTRIMKLGRRPGDGAEMAILEFIDFDFAQRKAEKKVAEKAAQEKKETLLDKAKRLVTGEPKGEKPEGAAAAKAEDAEATEQLKKKAAKAAKAAAPKTKAPKPTGGKGPKGGSHTTAPRKSGAS